MMKQVNKLASKFLKLPTIQKAAIVGVGVGVGAFATQKLFFNKYDFPGLPPAKNLSGFAPSLTRDEAIKILNLPSGFSQNDVQEHHRDLMSLHHPDKGGSSYVATKINESRDFLVLGSKK